MEIINQGIIDISGFANKKQSQEFIALEIPFYQRPYKWEKDNIRELFNDYISDSANGGHYFLGTVIAYLKETKNSEVVRYEIIDGQQRLTTLFLLNYLQFLMLRARIENQLLNQKNPLKNYDDLKKCYQQFMGSKCTPDSNYRKMEENYRYIQSIVDDEDDENTDYEKLLKVYREAVGLPHLDEQDENYEKEYKNSLKLFLEREELVINYSRDSLNDYLQIALSKVIFSYNKFELIIKNDTGINNQPIQKYLEVLEILFDNVTTCAEKIKGNTPKRIRESVEFIQKMLQGLQICLLTSKNIDDAYTLFEVLNDRGCEMSDLELMKNMFIKQFCICSSGSYTEKQIENLDEGWEKAFEKNAAQSEQKLIAYLGTVYLSADMKIDPKQTKKNARTVIKKNRLSGQHYSYIEACNDINIFNMVKIILDRMQLKYSAVLKEAIAKENSNNSIIYKTFNLLHGLGCDGVLPLIVNVMINDFKEQCSLEFDKEEIDLNRFDDYVNSAIKKNVEADYKCSEIVYRICDTLWKICLMTDDYEIARKIVNVLVPECYRDKYDKAKIEEKMDLTQYTTNYIQWLKGWRYRNGNQNAKVAICLLRLYREYQKKHNDKGEYLEWTKNQITIEDDIDLDHLEPKKINNTYEQEYFSNNELDERNEVINRVGNMMVLNKSNNIAKTNKPLIRGLCEVYGKDSRIKGSFLFEDILKLLEVKPDELDELENEKKIVAPSEDFFIKREELLINYFVKLLTAEYDTKQIYLG